MKPMKLGATLLGMSLLATGIENLLAQTLPPIQNSPAFYSTQNPDWPPLPANSLGVPQVEVSPGVFWLDDLNVNYAQLQQEALLLNALESSMEEGPPSPPGAGGEESPPAGDSGDALGGRLFLGSCTGRLLSPVYQVTNLVLSIAGATTGDQYDLYTAANLNVTNWTWLGRWTNAAASWTINNPPTNESYYAVACVDDADGEGLPDVYEVFASHTDPNDPDTDYDGRNDAEELTEGTLPLSNTNFTPTRLGYFRFNDESLIGERG